MPAALAAATGVAPANAAAPGHDVTQSVVEPLAQSMTQSMTQPTALTATERAFVVDLTRQVARDIVLPRFRRLGPGAIMQKSGPQDLVTEADLAAEAALTAGLRTRFPGALVVGEEAVAADPRLRDRMAEAPDAFVIDPVDGTWNFAHGLPCFGMIIARLHHGVPVYGLILDPICDDWVTAWPGGGAWLCSDTGCRALRVRRPAPLIWTSGYAAPWFLPAPQRRNLTAALCDTERVLSLRCSAQEYRMLAQGHVGYALSAMLHPWDHAAGALILTEAGGHVRFLDGARYTAARQTGHLLAAPDPATWEALAARIIPALA